MSSIISLRGPQCFIGELTKSRKTCREIKLKISLAFEMLGLNLQSLPEYSIDSMPLKGGGGGGGKGEEEGKREGNGEQSLRVLTQSDSYK